eukprot:TRINITY_DN4847_c0_g2_i1.p14 TRINITY_DN4847_c0_g2~~TRINITY_DN4847_c0_g2_i1.p14  ORF type:complete len:100 (-),score=4.65 TRINITY_DN4847_c0_g2_i1:1244-1543(-)
MQFQYRDLNIQKLQQQVYQNVQFQKFQEFILLNQFTVIAILVLLENVNVLRPFFKLILNQKNVEINIVFFTWRMQSDLLQRKRFTEIILQYLILFLQYI